MTSRFFGALLLTLVCAAVASSQTAAPGVAGARVDFGRDVRPIFQEHCLSCHGATQQMNGFRLDRRSAALRGGTFPVIGPGNAEGSRLYLKLLGARFGGQMPPAGKLPDEQIATIKNWLDQGAEWPDALAGELPPRPVDPAATRMMTALRTGDRQGFTRALTAASAAAKSFGPAGWTPLLYAALYGDADSVGRLIAAGADPNVATESGTTPLVLAITDEAKTRALLEAGANPNARPDDGRTALILAASRRGSAPVLRLLLDKGADVRALSVNRTNALRQSAAAGDVDSMRLLIERGANLMADAVALVGPVLQARCVACLDLITPSIDARALANQMIALARTGDTAGVRLLLDRGVDVNARDGQGRTALMVTATGDAYPLDVVRLLIERGADVNARATNGDTAASLAASRGGALADLLVKAGGTAVPMAPPRAMPSPLASHTARAAVSRSIPLLQKADDKFLRTSGCVSCHNNSLTAMMLETAREFRLPVNEAIARNHHTRIPAVLEGWREAALHGIGIPGGQDTVSYILMGMRAAGIPSSEVTDAQARYLLSVQLPDGHWRVAANRPPIESSDIQVTAATLRSLQFYAPAPQKAEYDRAIAAAGRWLAAAAPMATEDRAFQLLGLTWAGGDRAVVTRRGQELVGEQRADGGWAPIGPSGMASDAYATGEALHALREAGVLTPASAAYQRGVRYLLGTQLSDGSWHVATRAQPVQAYFESDFPHGRDQFISTAATNWATMALIPVAAAETTGAR